MEGSEQKSPSVISFRTDSVHFVRQWPGAGSEQWRGQIWGWHPRYLGWWLHKPTSKSSKRISPCWRNSPKNGQKWDCVKPYFTYILMGFALEVTGQERDLEVVVDSSIKVSTVFSSSEKGMPGIIRKGIEHQTLSHYIDQWWGHVQNTVYSSGLPISKRI